MVSDEKHEACFGLPLSEIRKELFKKWLTFECNLQFMLHENEKDDRQSNTKRDEA